MKKIYIILSLSALLLSLGACKFSEEIFVEYPRAWGIEFNNCDAQKLDKDLAMASKTATFRIDTGSGRYFQSIDFNDGLLLAVPLFGWYYTDNNASVTPGSIITIEEIYQKSLGHTIRNKRTTITADAVLETGGSFYQRYSVGSREVKNNGHMYFKMKDLQNPSLFNIFTSTENENIWTLDSDSTKAFRANGADREDTIAKTNNGAEFADSCFKVNCNLRWINCDYFYSNPNTKTENFTISLPKEFGNVNSRVYMVFTNEKAICPAIADTALRVFKIRNGYTLPVGLAVRLVCVSRVVDKYYIGTTNVVISDGGKYTIQPLERTLDALEAELDTLN